MNRAVNLRGRRNSVFSRLCLTCLWSVSFYASIANAGVAEGEAAMRVGDLPLAIKEFMPDAERGNATAQLRLAAIYQSLTILSGNEQRVAEQHLRRAFGWYSRAADQNVVSAQRSVARMLRNGLGVLKDEGKADEWDRRASEILLHRADGGDVGAQKALADAYSYGWGVSKDIEQATYWLRKAAKQGDAEAFNQLGVHYWRGAGVKKDLVLAYALFALATSASNSDERAKEVFGRNLNQLGRVLSAEQKAKGDAMAKTWRVGFEPPETSEKIRD